MALESKSADAKGGSASRHAILWTAAWAPLGALLLAGGYLGEAQPAAFGDPAQTATMSAAWRAASLWALGLGLGGSGVLAVLLRGLPRMTGSKLRSERLAMFSVIAWNLAVLGAVGGIAFGGGQSGLLREAPWVTDLALGVVAIPLLVLVVRTHLSGRSSGWHPAVWWFALGLIGVVLAFMIGGAVWNPPGFLLPGGDLAHQGGSAGDADPLLGALQAQWIAALVVAPLIIGMLTYIVQAETGAALHSGRLAHFGIWSWVLLAPLGAVLFMHPDNTAGPAVKNIAAISSALLLVPLLFTFANLGLTARGHARRVFTVPSLRFAVGAGTLLTLAFIHMAIAGTRSFVAPAKFDSATAAWVAASCDGGALACTSFATSWAFGLLAGAGMFAGFAGAYHVLGAIGKASKIPESSMLLNFWLALIGVLGIYGSVAFAGFAEAQARVDGWGATRLAAALQPQFTARLIFAGLILLSALVFALNVRISLAEPRPVEEGKGLDLRPKEAPASAAAAGGGAH